VRSAEDLRLAVFDSDKNGKVKLGPRTTERVIVSKVCAWEYNIDDTIDNIFHGSITRKPWNLHMTCARVYHNIFNDNTFIIFPNNIVCGIELMRIYVAVSTF